MTKKRALIAVVVLVALVGAIAFARRPAPSPFVIPPSRITVSIPIRIGEVYYWGFDIFDYKTKDPIRFESARLLDVPSGLKIEGLYWVYLHPGTGLRGSYANIRPVLRGVRETIRPRTDRFPWELFVGLSANEPGHFRTSQLRLCYVVHGRHGCTTLSYHRVGIDVSRDPHVGDEGPVVTPWPPSANPVTQHG